MDLECYYKVKELDGLSQERVEAGLENLTLKYFNEAPKSVKYAGGGAFGIVYFVELSNIKVVIKAFMIKGMHKTQALETETLAKYSLLPMPKTYFIHDEDDCVPYNAIGMEFMEGVPAVEVNPNNRTKEKKTAMAECLIKSLNAIHQATNDKFGLLENPIYDNWLDYYKPFAYEQYKWVMENGKDAKHKIPLEMYEIMEESWLRFDEIFVEPVTKATLIHADLNVCNFMIDKKLLRPTAIIDPWRSMWGDRDLDLHQLYNITGKEYKLYETYKKNYEVSRTCDLKCAFYALYNEVFCYIQSQRSYDYIYPRMIKNLRKQMIKFLGK